MEFEKEWKHHFAHSTHDDFLNSLTLPRDVKENATPSPRPEMINQGCNKALIY